jgi:hypothetical protein
MIDATNQIETQDDDVIVQPNELDMLKTRARMMNITFSNNIGVEALRAKINAKLEGEPIPMDATDNEPNGLSALTGEAEVPANETLQQLRERLNRDCLRLVRVRITNLDPKKKDLSGEIITVGNEIIGTVKKFVPFGEATENGYHIPHIIYEELKSRQFLNIRTSKKAGQIQVENGWAREFSIEVLPPLTKEELARLAAAQAAGNNIG